MANEAEIINNPDSTPGAVSTGYQAQNTRMVAASVGCDNTVVEGGTGECVLKLSGPVDVNGTLYTINTDVTFTLTTAGAYYIHLSGSGANLTPTIGRVATYAHTFDPDKNARYTDTGSYRVLNWIIHYDGTTAYAHRIITPENAKTEIGDLDTFEETWITGSGSWTAPRSKYYTMYLTGSGGSGGSGGCGANYNDGGNSVGSYGGAAGSTGIKRIWVAAGTIWTATISTNTVFTDSVTTLQANGSAGAVSGCDVSITGGSGGYGGTGGVCAAGSDGPSNSVGCSGSSGGASFYGSGGNGGVGGARSSFYVTAAGGNGGAASCYGGGGGCGGGGGGTTDSSATTSSGGSGGSGKAGCIRIIG